MCSHRQRDLQKLIIFLFVQNTRDRFKMLVETSMLMFDFTGKFSLPFCGFTLFDHESRLWVASMLLSLIGNWGAFAESGKER